MSERSITGATITDASGFEGHPDREFIPQSASEVAAIVAEANRIRMPFTIAGGRTGVTGGCCPHSGWLISLDRLRSIEIADGVAHAGAGLLLKDLQAAAEQRARFYAPDPTEWTAALGGSIATNASGSRSYRYGATRQHIVSLECVMADGAVRVFNESDRIDFDVPAIPLPATTKNTAGYLLSPGMRWIDLICGSEGTLAIVTAAAVKLLPKPAQLSTGVFFFASDAEALASVDRLRQVPAGRMIEYLDAGSLELLRPAFPEIPTQAAAAILFEQETPIDAMPELDGMLDQSWFAASSADRERFRRFRHALPERVNDTVRRRGLMKLGSDFAVPIARNSEMLAAYRETLDREFANRYVLFGHIGDAHLHANILPADKAEFDRGTAVMLNLARYAVSLGGTVSAEHGLGKRKAHLLRLQYDDAVLEAMMAVKRRLDPQWLLGQGTLFPLARP
jgi:FAD/FMN-containing dehydrogenase